MVGRFRAPCGSALLLPDGLRGDPDRAASLVVARRHPYSAQKLERRLDLGGDKHSLKLRVDPHGASSCTNARETSRLGRLCPPRPRICRGARAVWEDCRLRRGGVALGAVRLLPASVRGRQISRDPGRGNATLTPTRARDGREPGADAPRGLLCRCGRLRLAGTKGILVSSDPFRRPDCGDRYSVACPVPVPARSEPHPTTTAHSRPAGLYRPAHAGNLRNPACRLRAHRKVGARSHALSYGPFRLEWG